MYIYIYIFLDITDNDFENEVLLADTLVLVDFCVPRFNPCRLIDHQLEELAKIYGDKLKVVKINLDKNRVISKQRGIRALPTLMLFKDGVNVETKVGASMMIEEYEINRYL